MKRPARACKVCKEVFWPRKAGGILQVFCTPKCKRYWDNHQPRAQGRFKEWWAKNPDYHKKRMAGFKRQILFVYGDACQCCGETHPEFLTLDHIKGGGNQHRRSIKGNFYEWIIAQGYPEQFQILCMNCNWARRFNRICPHEREAKYGLE